MIDHTSPDKSVVGGKVCTICERRFPLTEFYKTSTSSDGRKNQCKDCHNRRSKERKTQGVILQTGTTKNNVPRYAYGRCQGCHSLCADISSYQVHIHFCEAVQHRRKLMQSTGFNGGGLPLFLDTSITTAPKATKPVPQPAPATEIEKVAGVEPSIKPILEEVEEPVDDVFQQVVDEFYRRVDDED